jgi:hypothetical protein
MRSLLIIYCIVMRSVKEIPYSLYLTPFIISKPNFNNAAASR